MVVSRELYKKLKALVWKHKLKVSALTTISIAYLVPKQTLLRQDVVGNSELSGEQSTCSE